jgi:hypothetical protein
MAYSYQVPGLNYDAQLQAEDYKQNRTFIEQAILERFLLSTGSPPNSVPQTGIVDILNPALISSSENTRPFLVTVSTLNALNIAINPGLAVTSTGALVNFAGNFNFTLARTLANDVNVVYVQNQLISGGVTETNDYMEPLASQDVQNPTVLNVALIQDWNNVSLFPPSLKNNIVVLAVVTVVPTANSGLALQIDMTQNNYQYNRPWFSIKDLQHRSFLGSGTATPQNPHATSINDLTPAGTVGLFQGLVDTGFVVSRDTAINKMVGATFCTESIPLSRIQTDSGGTVTANSEYGKTGALYVVLQAFPTRLGAVYQTGTPANSYSAEVIEGTNILVFGPNENITVPLTVEYTDTIALLPPVSAPTPVLTFGVPATNEVIVTGGLTYATVPNPIMDFSASGPFPRRYLVYQLGNASLVSYPQIMIPATSLNAIGTSLYPPAAQMAQPARIRLGITKANNVVGMDIQVTLNGLDTSGNSISEVVELSNALGYQDELVPSTNYDSPNQSVVSVNTYSSLTNLQITNRVNDGPLSILQLWAEIEPATSPGINDATLVSRILWNGQGIVTIEDLRVISKGFFRPNQQYIRPAGEVLLDADRVLSNIQVSPLMAHSSIRLFTEDFEDLRFFETAKGFFPATGATGVITIQNNGFIANNDTIQLTPSKTITFVTGVPNIAAGQVQIGATVVATINNIIATVNAPSFASNVLATVGTGTNVNLQILSPLGSIANTYTIVATLNNVLAITVSGFSFGYDAYGECYLNRSMVGIKSLVIPPDINLNPSGYQFRERYRSRPHALPVSQGVQSTFGVEVHNEDKFYPTSVRIRGSTLSAPSVWSAWQIMTPIAAGQRGFYQFAFSGAQHKIQIEYYGRARALTVFNIRPNP